MSERLLTIRLTDEELRLLHDNFCASFIHDGVDPDTEILDRISGKLNEVLVRSRKKATQ